MENAILILVIGIGCCYIGYGPLSLKKKPTAGAGFAAVGFFFRLAGPLLTILGILLVGTVAWWRLP
jgi:hypothetical protein